MQSWLKTLQLTANDNSAKQVASIMGITIDGVVKNLLRARQKLGAKTTAGAIYKAAKTGLICLLVTTSFTQQIDSSFMENVSRTNRSGSRAARTVRVARRANSEKMV